MRKFDTKVQLLKYKVLREVARHAYNDTLYNSFNDISKTIVKGKTPTMRCCIYKERAIVGERIKLATGGNKANPNVIEVIEIACDECPVSGYTVSDACRGCIAHRCEDVCKKGAITFDENQRAIIDKSKCVECGQCAAVCPYSAISNHKRPCERACKIGAISMGNIGDNEHTEPARIDNEKCISCGACVYQCPFGAIMDKSYILDVIDIIKERERNDKMHLYAVVAPAIASQFQHVKLGQVISAIKALGFDKVVEAALGADMVSYQESRELMEKGFLTSSCCPAFVSYIKKTFPEMAGDISHNLSPMATVSKYIKEQDPEARVIFIGPCTAKKAEIKTEAVSKYVDSVLTFEELQALIDSRDIPMEELETSELDNATYYGRIFARSGGLADSVREALAEAGQADFDYNPIVCNGIEECRMALLRASKHALPNNFIEGMACSGGCIGGAGCMTHSPKARNQVDNHGKEAIQKKISEVVEPMYAKQEAPEEKPEKAKAGK